MMLKYLYSDQMKYPRIILLMAFLFSGGTFSASWVFKENMRAEYKKQAAVFVVASNKYLSIDNNLTISREYYKSFLDLYKQGIFGEEHRLNWVEVLDLLSKKIQLPNLTYSIDAQQEYVQELPVNFGNFKLYSSTMKLNLKMLHEGDLLKLLEGLNENAEGLFIINACDISFLGDVLVKRSDGENITAYCELQWLNIHNSDGTEVTL